MTSEFRDFLELPYAELEELNLKAKEHAESTWLRCSRKSA